MTTNTVVLQQQEYVKLHTAKHELIVACKSMLKCTGGSENWDGCTRNALVMMEAAVKRAESHGQE